MTSSVGRLSQAGEIPIVIGNRGPSDVNIGQLFHGCRDVSCNSLQDSTSSQIHGCHIRLGLFNARSVAGKSAAFQQWIKDTKLSLAALVETWHDDASSPQLIACAPPGFRYVESARPRNNLSTNHGGICLFYGPSLYARTVQLPVFATFEAVAAFIHRAGFKAVVVIVYRPGSCGATQTFYDDFSDMLERLSTFSAPLMIAGDFNIHVDDETDVHACKLTDLLACMVGGGCPLVSEIFDQSDPPPSKRALSSLYSLVAPQA